MLLSLVFGLSSSTGRALAQEPATEKSESPELNSVKIVNRLSLLVAYQAPLDLDKVGIGTGLAYTRDYFVGPNTALGIHLALRTFPVDPLQLALGYGLTIRHYLGSSNQDRPGGFYLLYGLLLQMNYLSSKKGTATGHDTLLAAGFDFQSSNWLPFLEVGYHLTQVRSFDDKTLWWPYAETQFGFRF
ncbi:MAG: hypothetical protein MK135_03195 [Polyangiaceae bacterium]|nr:hypothetical protein [Polyangiaceae bacterium]